MLCLRSACRHQLLPAGLVLVLIICISTPARGAPDRLAASQQSTTAPPDEQQIRYREEPFSWSYATHPAPLSYNGSELSTRVHSRTLLDSPALPTAPFSAAPSPPARILIHNESDLVKQILAASGPSVTTLMLPAFLSLTKALPLVVGSLELVAAGAASVVTCSSSNFTAITVNTSSFLATGLTFSGCGTVLKLQSLENGTDSSVTISSCIFQGNLIDPAAAASCIDATQGFAGSLAIIGSVFQNNGMVANSSSAISAPPIAISCAGGQSLVSCSIRIQDTLFDNNYGQEALGMGISCITSASQSCNFDFKRTNFTNNQLVGNSSSYVSPYYSQASTGYHIVGTTAAALVVTAPAVGTANTSSFTLTVQSCNFAANSGAGLWVLQERNDTVWNPLLLGEVTISNSSFTDHAILLGGMPALTVFGARVVLLVDTVWRGNSLGAAALEIIQDLVFIESVNVLDNTANSATLSSFDIHMMDMTASNVSISNSLFVNNSGISYLPAMSLFYTAGGAVTIRSHSSMGLAFVNVSATKITGNNGFLSPGSLLVGSAQQLTITGVIAIDNYGGAMLLIDVATVVIQSSFFTGHTGLGGARGYVTSIYDSASFGGGTITALNDPQGAGGSLTITSCKFENNTALTSGAALFVGGFTIISVTASQFQNCHAWTGYGGAIDVNLLNPVSSSMVSITDSSFEACTAAAAGGAVFVAGPVGNVSVTRCTFSNTTAGILTGPGGWVQDPFAFVQATYTLYPLSRGGGALFMTQVALLSVVDSTFLKCTSPHSIGGAIRLRFSKAAIVQNCVFMGNSALSGGAMSLTNMDQGGGEVVEISNSTFVNNAAYLTTHTGCPGSYCIPNDDVLVPGDGGAVQINGCTLLLSGGCIFQANTAAGRGGGLFAGLPFDSSYVQILPQPGTSFGSGALAGVQALAGMPFHHFMAFINNTAGVAGGGIASRNFPLYMSSLTPDGTHKLATLDPLNFILFQGNSAPTGGALSVFQTPLVTIAQVLFYGNQISHASAGQTVADEGGAGNGGAICIVGSVGDSTTLSSAMFMNNTAMFGGGLHIRASPTCSAQQQADGCFSVNIDEASSFVGNSAQGGAGGAVFWSHPGNLQVSCGSTGRIQLAAPVAATGMTDTMVPCVSWIGNTVANSGYGPVIASTPFYLNPVERRVPFYSSNQPLLLNVTVQDYYGQLVVGSSRATAAPNVVRLESSNATGVVLGGLDESDGIASFTGVRLRGLSGSTFNMSFSALTKYRTLTPLGQSSVTVRPCQLNEYVDPGSMDLCVNCTSGTYNLIPTSTTCSICPVGAICSDPCLGNATCQLSSVEYAGFIVPADGQWHSSMFSNQVMACPNPASCTYTLRQLQLQQLQVAARNTYQQHQLLLATGQNTTSDRHHHHRSLAEQLVLHHTRATPTSNNMPNLTLASLFPPLSVLFESLLPRSRSLLTAAPATPPPIVASPNYVPPAPAPQHSPSHLLFLTAGTSADDAFLDSYFISVATNMTAYSSSQCADGYTGRLCSVCASGYGSTAIATCFKCPSFGHNTLYYMLATLLTLALLAFTLNTSVQGAVKLQSEFDEKNNEEQEEEDVMDETLQTEGGLEHIQQQDSGNRQEPGVVFNSMVQSHVFNSMEQSNVCDELQVKHLAQVSRGQPELVLCVDSMQQSVEKHEAATHADCRVDQKSRETNAGNSGYGASADNSRAGTRARRNSIEQAQDLLMDSTPHTMQSTQVATKFSPASIDTVVLHRAQDTDTKSSHIAASSKLATFPLSQHKLAAPPVAANNMACDDLTLSMAQTPNSVDSPPPASSMARKQGSTVVARKVNSMSASNIIHKKNTGQKEGYCLGSEEVTANPQRSHFYDHRDPILEDAQQALNVILRIFVSYVQVLGLLQNVPHIYPAAVQKFLNYVFQSSSVGTLVSLDCSLPEYSSISKATIQTLIFTLVPLYVAAACWVGWFIRALFLYMLARLGHKSTSGINPTASVFKGISAYLSRSITLSNVVVVFFFYPSALQALLEIFDCNTVDSGSPSNPLMAREEASQGLYWQQDYSQQCYSGSHQALAMGLGVPGLVLLALGWPLLCAVFMYLNQHKLYIDPQFTGMYAFMFEGYQPRYGWWESVVMLRKLSIALLVVFLHIISKEGLQLLIVSMVLGISLWLQAHTMPYEHGYMNWLEFLSLIACTVTIYFSLFFANSLKTGPLTVVTVFVLLINAVTMFIFICAMIRASWHTMLQMLKLSPEEFPTMSKSHIRAHILSSKVDLHPMTRTTFAAVAVMAQQLDFTIIKLQDGARSRIDRVKLMIDYGDISDVSHMQ